MVEVSNDGLERARDAYSVEWFKVPDGTHAFVRAETAALAAIATLQAERDRYRVALEPFAAVADYYDDDSEPDDFSILADLGTLHTMKVSKLGYYRAARTALSDTPAVQS